MTLYPQAPGLWSKNVYDEDRGRLQGLWEDSFREGKEFCAEYRVRHKNGHTVYVMDHGIPIRAADGHISSVDGIIVDITGRVKLREKLVRSKGLKTISEVSARLAHEIRNPLMSAGGFARRLLSAMDTADPNRAKVEIIVKEVGRLEAILRMILNYLQPVELHMSPTDPNKLVKKTLSGMATEIKVRNVRVDLQLDLGVPEISADGRQMKRVVEALVKNALNQMPEAATLSVSTSRENNMFNLVMRYPVSCMSSDDVEDFFYPFTTFRIVHDTVYDTVDLPMSKTIVEKHGGIINVGIKKSHELIIHISLPA